MNKQNFRVLVTAHEISPYQGSECRSGWNILKELSYLNNLVIICPETNQFETSSYKLDIIQEKNQFHPKTCFIFIPQPVVTRFIASINRKLFGRTSNIGNQFLYFIGVRFWEKSVKEYIHKNNLLKDVDIVHHFNHITFREPGFLYDTSKQFFIGPVSGVANIPHKFILKFKFFLKVKYMLRNFLNNLRKRSGRIKNAAKKASAIFCVTTEDKKFFSKFNNAVIPLNDMGVDVLQDIERDVLKNRKLKIIWVGRIDELKCLDILINVVNSSKFIRSNVTINIIGDGPLCDTHKKRIKKLQMSNIFNFVGKVEHSEVKNYFQDADLLVHTSIKEAGSSVILESISTNTPFLSHNAFGMKFLIEKGMGFGVEMEDPISSKEGFAAFLEDIIKDRELLERKIDVIEEIKKEMSWSHTARIISKTYINKIE